MTSIAHVSTALLALLASGGFPIKISPLRDFVREGAGELEQRLQHAIEGQKKHLASPQAQDSPKAPAAPEDKGSLPALIDQEKAALKASATALEHLQDTSAETQKVAAEKEAAEKKKKDTDKVVSVAMAKVRDAKRQRVEAAKLDVRGQLPADESPKKFAAANALVEAAERSLVAATRAAAKADGAAEKAKVKARRAFDKKVAYKEELEHARSEAERLASEVASEEEKMRKAVASLHKEEASMSKALEKQLSQG